MTTTLYPDGHWRTKMIDFATAFPWVLTIISLLIAAYSLIKNAAKDDKHEAKKVAIDSTTVIVKLENIQQVVNESKTMMTSIQGELKNLEHRVTVIETKMGEE